jgi:ESS family glutamate:Na+ symporter
MDLVLILMDFCICGIFLVIGVAIRAKIRFFQRYVIPAAVIGGVIGLILSRNVLGWVPTSEYFPQYANILIDVLFAGLFIGRRIPGFKFLAKTAGAQAAYAYFNAFGQIAVGLLVVSIFGALGVALHPIFGVELIVGYQGGPGVATAVAPMIEKLGWAAQESAAVGEACAIAGLILAVLVGVIIVNIGIARGLTAKGDQGKGRRIESPTILSEEQRRPLGMEIIGPDAASSITFNFGFMAMAVIGGKLIVMGIVALAPMLQFLPTFPFVLVAGIILQVFLQNTGLDRFVDRQTVESISFFALDILIVAALIAIKLDVIVFYAAPLITMIVLGLIFNLAQFYFLAPKILPGAWFEKGLCEYGQNTGAVPQALLLLKMADPRFETDAAEALALKMFLFSPIVTPMTMLMLPALVKKGPEMFIGIFAVAMILVLLLCRIFVWQSPGKTKA